MEIVQPKLRLPEFEGNWTKDILGNLIEIKSGYSPSTYNLKLEGLYPFIKVDELNNCNKYQLNSREYSDDSKGIIPSNSIIFPKRGAAILNNKVRINSSNILMDSNMMALLPKKGKIYSEFLYYLITKVELYKIADTSTIPQINNKHIEPFNVNIPSVEEQTRIANFLSSIDEKLNLLKEKKALLEDYKKGIMQKIFNQEIRFKDDNGQDFEEWESIKLSDILKENKTRNKANEITEVFSVAKSKGVINQIEHLGRSYASNNISNYKVVFENDVVYTKSPTSDFPYGIIKQNKLNRKGVVSVLYGIFTPINKYVGILLDNYFSDWKNTYNYLDPIVQKGAKNTINIGNETFLNGVEIMFPIDIKEQTKIANFLSAIDEKIELVSNQIEDTQEYKKGLLQQMFV